MAQIRGPFILPRTSPQICGIPGDVVLQSGGVYLFPSGDYLVIVGPNTQLQYFNPLKRCWVPVMLPMPSMLAAISCDGGNYRLFNASGSVVSATASGGSGGTNGIGPQQTGVTLTFAATTAPGITAEGFAIVGGTVPAPTVVQPGQDFEIPPVICCDPPPDGGIQASFVCALNATGGIASVTVVNPGAGYLSVPQFYIIPQPKFYQGAPRWPLDHLPWYPAEVWPPHFPWPARGLVAAANVWPGTIFQSRIDNIRGALLQGNALTGSGALTGAVIIYGGGNYSAAPAITVTSSTLTGGTATATLSTATAAVDTSIVQALVQA